MKVSLPNIKSRNYDERNCGGVVPLTEFNTNRRNDSWRCAEIQP